jgi:hypothetical protein
MTLGTLSILNAAVVDLLAGPVARQSLKGITVEHFGSVEEIGALLARYKARMPGAFFCPSTVTFTTAPVQTTNVLVSYLLLVGIPSRRAPEDRYAVNWLLADEVASCLNYRSISRAGLPTTSPVDFVRLTRLEYADHDVLSAFLLGFDIAVRNWQP